MGCIEIMHVQQDRLSSLDPMDCNFYFSSSILLPKAKFILMYTGIMVSLLS